MNIIKFSLFENADTLFTKVDNEIIETWYKTGQCKPFCWESDSPRGKPGEIWVGPTGAGHDSSPFNFNYEIFHGRMWIRDNDENLELKVLSFWDIASMTRKDVEFCVNSLSKETGINFSDWKLDLGGNKEHSEGSDLMPVKDFKGGIVIDDLSSKRIDHLKNAAEKERERKEKIKRGEEVIPKGWGSKSSKNDPRWRFALGENLKKYSKFTWI